MAKSGRSVLLLDADFRNPGAAELLGLENSVGTITVLLGPIGVIVAAVMARSPEAEAAHQREVQAILQPNRSPAGWWPDPLARHQQRYFDGARWTEHVVDGSVQGVDPA